MDQEEPQPAPKSVQFKPDPSMLQLSVSFWPRDVGVYQVFDYEFRMIKASASQSGLYLTFFGVSFGLMAALLIVLATVELTSPRVFAAFVVGFAVSLLLTALLAIVARREYKQTHSQIDFIEKQSIKRQVPMQSFTSLSVPYTSDSTESGSGD